MVGFVPKLSHTSDAIATWQALYQGLKLMVDGGFTKLVVEVENPRMRELPVGNCEVPDELFNIVNDCRKVIEHTVYEVTVAFMEVNAAS